jgi:hypothetical protein
MYLVIAVGLLWPVSLAVRPFPAIGRLHRPIAASPRYGSKSAALSGKAGNPEKIDKPSPAAGSVAAGEVSISSGFELLYCCRAEPSAIANAFRNFIPQREGESFTQRCR